MLMEENNNLYINQQETRLSTITMPLGNVLVIGNSGVGKSTLINSVLGESITKTSYGNKGETDELAIFKNNAVPFQLIDTIGFEPNLFKRMKAINAVKKWSHNSIKKPNENKQINVIWFCIDGMTRKLFPETIKNLLSATSLWKNVPIIVVITKSYAETEIEENIKMVENGFSLIKNNTRIPKKIIPVVASALSINETTLIPPKGINELISTTLELMPEGIKKAKFDIANYKITCKRTYVQSLISAATLAGVVVGAVPKLPLADGVILTPLEISLINAIAKIYNVDKIDNSQIAINSIIQSGTVGIAAKTVLSALNTIPNIPAATLNAVVAGCFVAALGESSAYIFEQVYLGKKSINDLDWINNILQSTFTAGLIELITQISKDISDKSSKKIIAGRIVTFIANQFSKNNKKH